MTRKDEMARLEALARWRAKYDQREDAAWIAKWRSEPDPRCDKTCHAEIQKIARGLFEFYQDEEPFCLYTRQEFARSAVGFARILHARHDQCPNKGAKHG